MSFIVRQLSKTADGREIIRSSNFDGSAITVGRGADNAIVLADLAVDMNHARIVAASRGRIAVESTGGLEFLRNGRSVTQCDIDVHEGAELGFGSHKLTISAEGDAAVVTVQRVSSDADTRDERQIFQLAGLLPSRRSLAWTFAIALLALFLAWPIWTYSNTQGVKERQPGFHADSTWESGKLSLAHHSLEENCQACHVNKFEAVQDKSCLACHKQDAHDHAPMNRLINARAEPGLGGSLKQWVKNQVGKPQGQCVECHTEHEGEGKMPRTAQAFCTDCHATLQKQLPDTKLADASDFGTGHPQFMVNLTVNPGTMPRQVRRVALDGSALSEDNGLKFPHDIHLSKTNSIARMTRTLGTEQGWGTTLDCKDCHIVTPDGVRFQPMTMEANCQACHSLAFDQIGGTVRTLRHGEPEQVMADLRGFNRSTLPPRPVNLGGMARRQPGQYAAEQTATTYLTGARQWPNSAERAIDAVFSKGGACYDCHIISRANGIKVTPVTQPNRYMENGWFDHKAHDTEKCESCHKADSSKKATDVLLPDLASCRTCHVGESGARIKAVDKPVKSGCAMCHDYHISPSGAPWRPEGDRNKIVGKVAEAR